MGAAEPPPVRVPFGPGQPPFRAARPPLPLQLVDVEFDLRSTLDMLLRTVSYLRAERRRIDGREVADQAFAAIGYLLDAYEDNGYRLEGE